MAFNPFRVFRKHQKVLFSALTIVVMLLFVFTYSGSGGGRWDQIFVELFRKAWLVYILCGVGLVVLLAFWSRSREPLLAVSAGAVLFVGLLFLLVDLTGLARAKESTVAKVYGSRVSEKELVDLARRRRMYFSIINVAMATAIQRVREEMDAKGSGAMNFQNDSFQRYIQLLQMQQQLKGQIDATGDAAELLDFIMWQKQADRLGIALNDEDITKLFSKRMGAKLDTYIDMLHGKSEFSRLTPEEARAAVGEEYRVQLAQETLLGSNQGQIRGMAPPITAYDFLAFCQKNRKCYTVDVLPIPVKAFLDEVTEQPSERQLRNLFRSYDHALPDPARRDPAFKQPRQIEIAWVTLNTKIPTYAELATLAPSWEENRFAAQKSEQVSTLVPLTPDPVVNVLQLGMYHDQLLRKYDSTKFNYRTAPAWDDKNAVLPYLYGPPSAESAAQLVFALGLPQSAGQAVIAAAAPEWSKLLKPIPQERKEIIRREQQRREAIMIQLQSSLALPALSPTVGGLANNALLIAGENLAAAHSPYLPFDIVKDELVTKLRTQQIEELQKNALDAVEKELTPMQGKSPEDADQVFHKVLEANVLYRLTGDALAALHSDDHMPDADLARLAKIKDIYFLGKNRFLDELKKVLGGAFESQTDNLLKRAERLPLLESGKSDKPRDKWNIQNDLNLKRLLTDKVEPGESFTDLFAEDNKTGKANAKPFDVSKKSLGPKAESFLFWKTKEIEPQIPSFEDEITKEKVKDAWKLVKARAIAETYAESLKKQFSANANDINRQLTQLKGEAAKEHPRGNWVLPYFLPPEEDLRATPKNESDKFRDEEGKGIALLALQNGRWEPSVPPKNLMPYPPDDFAATLHKKLKKPGDSTVILDKPGTTFYLVVLCDISTSESIRQYCKDELTGRNAILRGQGSRETLWQYMEQERLKDYRSDLENQLRVDAGLAEEDGMDDNGKPKYKDTFKDKLTEDLKKKLQPQS